MEDKFTDIYKNNKWGGGSGSGSKFTADNLWFLTELRRHIDMYDIKTIADLGCGDFEVMKNFNFKEIETYNGFDCVGFIINDLNDKYKNKNRFFFQKDITIDIAKGYDLVIIKDVAQHWTDEQFVETFNKILKNNKFVYCINGYKFQRVPSKNNWEKRELDKKYHYHPITVAKYPMNLFEHMVLDIKHRRAKEYILLKYVA
jgi:hypothetical protein